MSTQPANNGVSPDKEKTFWYTVARVAATILVRGPFPVRYHNKERFQLDAPYILISNHKSALDPLIIAKPCKKYEVRFVGKKELTKKKWVAHLLEKGLHMITVDRHNSDLAAMRQCMKVLREGRVLAIFPEGTRHLPDLMSEVESGTAVLALRANVPLLPVYISRKLSFLRLTHVYVGEPMDISDLAAQGMDAAVVEQVTNRIRETFLRMRADTQKK
ncbi:MAG: 1-acyl-sn-glycerol-3-phosphate acyltransferase [Clostridia bacterium]|nr:1-acyl-sn-glycerol-3-phosphate acyltransferase [Clostridia bacterium]